MRFLSSPVFILRQICGRKNFLGFFCNEEIIREAELNISKGHRVHGLMRNEGCRRENKKVGSICRNRKKFEKTNYTDVLSPERR